MALYMAILVGGTPLGAPIVGGVADAFGPRWALGVASIAAAVAGLIGLGWLIVSRGMRLARHPERRWRTVVQFTDAPTSAIAAIDPPVLDVLDDAPDGRDARDHAGLVPADFSEEVALTSPIPLPRAASHETGALRVAGTHRDAGAQRAAGTRRESGTTGSTPARPAH